MDKEGRVVKKRIGETDTERYTIILPLSFV